MDFASGKIELSERYIQKLKCGHTLRSYNAVVLWRNNGTETLSVTAANNSDLALVISGIHQRSCLGPLLFLICINDIHCAIQSSKTEICTDDANVSNSSHSIAPLEKEVNDGQQNECKQI